METNMVAITASQLGRCLTLDTQVQLANGQQITISNLKEGDLVQGSNGVVKVVNVFPKAKQLVFKIKTKSGKEIKATAQHKFPTAEGTRSLEHGLTVGQKLYIKNSE
jgi:intein/homing endonuclease